jgi:flagellar basal body rod protein FlgB
MDGNTVDIDQEMVDLAETNLRFNALAQIATARFRSLRMIITDGRR